MIKDNGNRVPMGDTGFVRDCKDGVGRFDLLPWRAIMEVAKHCEEGAKKYGERNIDKGAPQHSLIDSAFRHLAKYTLGERDEDHLRACAWNILWALQQEVSRPDMIDIPEVKESRESLLTPVYCDNFPLNFYGEPLFERDMNESSDDDSDPRADVRRCVEHTCFYNTDGFCQSVSDLWNPDFGEKCPDYSED